MESERGERGEGNNIMPNGNIILKESEEDENCGKRLLKLICHCPLLIHIFLFHLRQGVPKLLLSTVGSSSRSIGAINHINNFFLLSVTE